MDKAEKIVQLLKLQPHPEGGFFKETYRSEGIIQPESLESDYKGNRNYSTCIYYLLTSDVFSAFHRIRQDEIWHFYQGSPIELHMITPSGEYSKNLIGNDIEKGQVPQFVVHGGNWFAASVMQKDDYSLAGCTVAPGFDFQDFEMAKYDELIRCFPQHLQIIKKFTRT